MHKTGSERKQGVCCIKYLHTLTVSAGITVQLFAGLKARMPKFSKDLGRNLQRSSHLPETASST